MQHAVSIVTATIANGAALSDAIDIRGVIRGEVLIPSAWTAADMGFQRSSTVGGTFVPAANALGNLIEITLTTPTDRSFSIPDDVFSASFIKLWSQTAGAGVNQGAARSVVVNLKT